MISPGDFETVAANDCQPMLGDVLLAKDGATCLDTVCEYRQPHKIVLLSSVAILRPKLIGSSAYLHIWLGLDSTKSYLKEGFVSGSAIPRVVLRDLKRAQLVVPDAPLLSAFTKCVEPLRDQTRRNNDECISLAAIRDVLLPKLLSGEIRVANAERLVEDAT
jgi:type I restriction enzyme S subunit